MYERALDLDGRRLANARLCATVPATLGTQPTRHEPRPVPARCADDGPAVDTRTLADGAHTLVARAEDVAGNARTASARVVVDNLPPRPGHGHAGRRSVGGAHRAAERLQRRGHDLRLPLGALRRGGCTEIGGAVSRSYRVRPRDAGHRLRAVVSATDGGGTVRVASAQRARAECRGRPDRGAAERSPPPARLTAWLERGRRRLRRTTVTWPERVRIRGHLSDLAGRPLSRTPVRMLERIAGGRWRPISGVRTRRNGRLHHVHPYRPVAAGPPRVRHRDGDAAADRPGSVRVRIRRHGSLTQVSGRVRGGRVPRAGLRALLQSRRFAGWRTRATLRTDGLGRFFASGRAPVGARLRVVVPAQRGYPYARGVGRP